MSQLKRYQWKPLNRQQIGTYAEYFVKMELTMHGFQVFTPEVDDRGVDFIARYGTGQWIEIQSKSKRGSGYVFMTKDKFIPSSTLYAAVSVFTDCHLPDLYLIPSKARRGPMCVSAPRQVSMSHALVISHRAEHDMPEAGLWYQGRRPGTGPFTLSAVSMLRLSLSRAIQRQVRCSSSRFTAFLLHFAGL